MRSCKMRRFSATSDSYSALRTATRRNDSQRGDHSATASTPRSLACCNASATSSRDRPVTSGSHSPQKASPMALHASRISNSPRASAARRRATSPRALAGTNPTASDPSASDSIAPPTSSMPMRGLPCAVRRISRTSSAESARAPAKPRISSSIAPSSSGDSVRTANPQRRQASSRDAVGSAHAITARRRFRAIAASAATNAMSRSDARCRSSTNTATGRRRARASSAGRSTPKPPAPQRRLTRRRRALDRRTLAQEPRLADAALAQPDLRRALAQRDAVQQRARGVQLAFPANAIGRLDGGGVHGRACLEIM